MKIIFLIMLLLCLPFTYAQDLNELAEQYGLSESDLEKLKEQYGIKDEDLEKLKEQYGVSDIKKIEEKLTEKQADELINISPEILEKVESMIDFKGLISGKLDVIKTEYNKLIGDLPWYLKILIGDNNINLVIELTNKEDLVLSAVIESGLIKEIKSEEINNPDIIVSTSDKNIFKIINKKLTSKEILDEKLINYEVKGFFRKIKIGLVEMFIYNFNGL